MNLHVQEAEAFAQYRTAYIQLIKMFKSEYYKFLLNDKSKASRDHVQQGRRHINGGDVVPEVRSMLQLIFITEN